MDIIEAEPLLGKSRNRIYRMIQRGEIPPEYVLHIGDRVYLHRETFVQWLSGKDKVKAE